MTVTEAARVLGLSRQHVHELVKKGQIKLVQHDLTVPGRGRFLLDAQSVKKEQERRKG